MRERGFASVYLRQEVGGVGGVEGAQLAVSLLRFVYFISVQVKKAQLCQSINVARPDINSFLVRSLGGFPLLLLVKTVPELEEIIGFNRRRIFCGSSRRSLTFMKNRAAR